ncbi:MAG TPA: hypothetical protein PLY85_10525 [Anaerolineaceae bacterium]|nr:hypothetical protein [Anaerolineaceae bacterium]
MPVIGQDCHIILSHPSLNAGEPGGFVLDSASKLRPEGIMLTRQFISGQGVTIWIYFDALLADSLLTPAGGLFPDTRSEQYALLSAYLQETEGITLQTAIGTFVNLGAVGFTSHEYHTPACSLVKACLTNAGVYFPPVDPAMLTLSVWDGSLTWETSYWR